MKYGNMHLHSNHSDGGFRPAFLARMAKSLGYGALALTDHETLSGIPELMEAAKNLGLESMTGIELVGRCEGARPHIVGLDFDIEHPAIVSLANRVAASCTEATRIRFEDMMERDCFARRVSWEEFVSYCPRTDFLCADHVFYVLDLLGLASISDHRKIRAAYKACTKEVPKADRGSVEETIKAIRDAGGVAVLAHANESYFDDGLVEEWIKLGLNGIEVSHPNMTERAMKLAIHMAMEHRLYCSGGTDHTGPMSACDDPYAIPAYQGVTKEEFDAIKERKFA